MSTFTNNSDAISDSLHPQFITSVHGNQMIKVGRYNFSLEKRKSRGPKKRWVCSNCSRGCRSVIITVEDVIIKYKSEHNH